ncbi:MAG: hypothetical protein GF355_03955 [Candidatus Eisenbacteria bacterium]|nr:hypothetical protein [Candidatus Eisenbacteria bacterium]
MSQCRPGASPFNSSGLIRILSHHDATRLVDLDSNTGRLVSLKVISYGRRRSGAPGDLPEVWNTSRMFQLQRNGFREPFTAKEDTMRRNNLILAALACALALAPLGPSAATVHEVMVDNFFFDPQDLTIAEGDTVRWVWVAGTHTTTSGDNQSCTPDGIWDAPIDSGNQTFEFDFSGMTGTFPYYCIPHCGIGMTGTIMVEDTAGAPDAPAAGVLHGLRATPTPFALSTQVRFALERAQHVRLEIIDASGRRLTTLAEETFSPGIHQVSWDGRNEAGETAPSGVYYVRTRTREGEHTAPMVLLR